MSRRKAPAAREPSKLLSLTGLQAKLLREAKDSEKGVYIGLSDIWGSAPHELVDGGAAEWREVRQIGSVDHRTGRPFEWTDLYLIPTAHGLALLERTP